jgi:23S rRNA pseudouridine1911/1915/1917 synthase
VISETVPAALAGERLDRVVALLADISRAAAAAVIAAGGVSVDGAAAGSGKVRLAEGAVVAVDPAAIPRTALPAADPAVAFDVVHADQAVIVVDKPPGLVVHPGAGNPDGTLVNGLLARFPELAGVGDPVRPGIVHRLDAGSSGLLVVARTAAAAESLVTQFAGHHAGRRYDAVVWGVPEAAHGIIDAPIGRDPSDPLRMAVVVDGRPSRTEYLVVARYDAPGELARLSCHLQTGRTHQIRVHLAAVGHPLVGDTTYGARRSTFGLARPFLHAAELAFDHPTTGQRLTFTSPLPADLATFLATADPSVEGAKTRPPTLG